jgi:hypothetical protein
MGLHDLAARLAGAGADLGSVAVALPGADPGAAAFGADATGRFGDLGRDLHRCCVAALDARAREARAVEARLADLADAVTRAGAAYDDADHAAQARFGAGEGRPGFAAGGPGPEWRRD